MLEKIQTKYLWRIPKGILLNLTLILSIVGFFSYEFTQEIPEIIPNGDIYYRFLSELSIGFIISYIFYVIVVYYPAKQIQRHQIHHLKNHIKLYLDIYYMEFNTNNLESLKSIEKLGPQFLQKRSAGKLNHDDKQSVYHTLFSAIVMFEKDLERYIDKFTSSYLSENAGIINQMELIHIKDEIINGYRSNIQLRRNTSDKFELNFISLCIFGKLPTNNGPYEIKDTFKTHIRNCKELIKILNKCYN